MTNPIKICTQMTLDASLQKEAARVAALENPANVGLPSNAPPDKVQNLPETAELALITGKMWKPGRTLKVRFMDGDPVVQEKVKYFARQWSEYANIQFDFGDYPDAEIRISFAHDGSWSYLGTDALLIPQDSPTMNFGWFTRDTSDQEFSRTTIHEFGHALGCIHEHQSPDANIPWNREAVYAYYARHGWNREMVDRNLFAKYDQALMTNSVFDQASIMLYAIPKELTTNGWEVGWNTVLSPMDKAFAAEVYPYPAKELVQIYEHVNFEGVSQPLDIGLYDMGNLSIGNDSLSSIKIPEGLQVTLFEHAGFTGRSITLTGDVSYVGDEFNDLTSSIIVEWGTVQIYEHVNFEGVSQALSPGLYDMESLSIGNDTLSSIRIPRGLQVTLFEHAGFTGRSITLTGEVGYVGDEFNDLTSSIIVEPVPEPVRIYEHGDYQGASQELPIGSYDMDSLSIGNDTLSSIKVPKGLQVTLFEHAGFTGRSVTFTEDVSYVGDEFNDLTSSIIVELAYVQIYEYADYQGRRQGLSVGQHDMDTLSIGNDTLSSIKIPRGLQVTLFEHAGFTGRSITLTGEVSYVGDEFNDLTSSIIIEPVPDVVEPEPEPEFVQIYEHVDYQGASQALSIGSYDTASLSIGDNTLSSIKVPQGLQVKLFRRGKFMGPSITLTQDVRDIGKSFNDHTSSIMVEPWLAQIYEHVDYQGASQALKIGRYDMDSLKIGNDSLSSIKIPQGLRVTLFEHAGFTGRSVTFTEDISYVGDEFNDHTSSIMVEPWLVQIYEHADYQGASQALSIGQYDMVNLIIPNDSLSSIKIPQGLRVTLFYGGNFTGKSITLTEDVNFLDKAFNDRTSSIIVEKVS